MHLEIQPENCTGCRICELFCSFHHEGAIWPARTRINVVAQNDSGPFSLNVCRQCEEAPCAEACPVGAIVRDEHTGAWMVDLEECTGCKVCVEACPFDALTLDEQGIPFMCDLCGGEPECVAMCPSGAIQVTVDGGV